MNMILLDFCVFTVITSLITGRHAQPTKCKRQGETYDCRYKDLTAIPRDIPYNLLSLDLSHNNINTVRNRSFQYLFNLTYLQLDKNQIRQIERDAFYGLVSLVQLNLGHNTLYSVPDFAFGSLVSVRDLSIQHNIFKGAAMTTLAKEISKLDSLHTLSIDISKEYEFPCDFNRLTKLSTLNVYGNDVFGNLTRNTFKCLKKTPIKILYIYGTISIEMDTFFPLSNLTDLTIELSTDVPSNPINEIFQSFGAFKGRNFSNIRLFGNRFNNAFTLGRTQLKYVEDICLRKFVLHSMYITYVNPFAMQLFSVRSRCLEYLEISNNVIYDERGFVLFSNIRNFKKLRVLKYYSYSHRDTTRSKRSSSFSSSSNLTLVLTNSLEELYLSSGLTLNSMSNIIVSNGLNMRIFSAPNNDIGDCKGYFIGMENLRYFDMSGWICQQLSENILTGFPSLETFIASNSYIGIGFEKNAQTSDLFKNNKRLEHIDLSRNMIRLVPNDLFNQPFENLNQVNLSLNKITSLPKFPSNLREIKTIDLSYNLITSFNDDELKVISEIEPVNIHLQGNPLQCSCNTLNFMKWANKTENVVDLVRLQCILNDGSRKSMSEVLANLHAFETKCSSKFWLVFSVTMISLLLIGLLFVIIYFRYKFVIEYILLKWKMWWNGYRPLQTDYTYDAFVSYSHHDSSWAKQFHDKLNDMGFNLCLDAKDFIAGRGIAENVMTAIDSSRKVIFIITRNFLGSVWGSFELEMTRMHAFREHREEMVIIVLKDNIRLDEMPKVLKNMWYKITCIQWPDDDNNVPFHTKEIFFEKMKHALRERRNEGTNQNVCV